MRVKRLKLFTLSVLVAIFGYALVFQHRTADAAINPQINFQGKLVNPDGTNVADGNYSIVFSLYNVSSGGTAIWTETQSSVAVSGGIFQVSLGSVTALPGSVDFNNASIYLGIKVGSDAEMTPRVQFTAAPYAFNADKLGGINSSGYIQIGPGSVQNDATTNPSVFLNKTGASGNILELQKNGTDVAVVDNSGNATFNQNVTVQNPTYTTNQVLLNDGITGSLPSFPNSYMPAFTIRVAQASGSRPLFFGYDNGAGTGYAAFLTSGACGSFTTMCLDLGTGTTASTAIENTGTTLNVGGGDDGNFTNVVFKNTGNVIIGSSTTDTTQVLLQVDSYSTFADTAACSVSSNQGAMYYNTATATFRGCINGNWEDMSSTGGLGLLAYGVIPDSANAGSPGDLAGITQSNSPCKVYWSAAQQVTVAPCYAYSGGRKVTVPSTPISTAGLAASNYANICLSGAGGAPTLLAGATTDAAAAQPTWSANNPILCLATIQSSTTAGNITGGKIYDVRTFTNTQKTFATSNTAVNLGFAVIQSATANLVTTTTTALTGAVRGVVIGYSGATSTTNANVILATAGPQYIKATASTVANYVETTTTAGYVNTATNSGTTASNLGYFFLGVATRALDTTCTSGTTCQYSQFVNPLTIR